MPVWDDGTESQAIQVCARSYTKEYQRADEVGVLTPTSDLYAVGVCIYEMVNLVTERRSHARDRGSSGGPVHTTGVDEHTSKSPDYRAQLLQVARALLSQDVLTQQVQGRHFVDWMASTSNRRVSDPATETGSSTSVKSTGSD